jgi:hypothetical protein
MTGKYTVCQNCKSARRKEKIWWICRKNCVERNNIDTCIMKPVQFEPIDHPHPEQEPEYIITEGRLQELEKNGWWDHVVKECRSRPYTAPSQTRCPPPGCPCNRYATCKECVEAQKIPVKGEGNDAG